MPKPLASIVQALARASARDLPTVSDRELLRRYAADGDQEAFAILVRRYSRLVLSVCRQSSVSVADAEDVCQATFLVLARKAKTARWQHSVANWLYTTARNLARNARTAARRRACHEQRAVVAEAIPSIETMTARELLDALGEEVEKLPAMYREPLVLNFFEEMSREEIAVRLGIPAGTVKTRLERGKKRLGDALAKRGVVSGFALLTFLTTARAGPSTPKLVDSILAAVGGSPSPAAAALAQGVVMKGVVKKVIVGIVTTVMIVGGGIGWYWGARVEAQTKPDEKKPPAVNSAQPPEKPADAVAREKVPIQVLDADGKPVAGATIRRVSRNRAGAIHETVLGKTDQKGRFEAEVVPQSSFTAVADGVGVAWSGDATPGKEVTLKIAKPQPIKGRLTDLQGKPVAGAKVRVESVAAATNDDLTGAYNAFRVNPEYSGMAFARSLDGRATGAPASVTTDKDGRFELSTVGQSQVVHLRFEAEGIEATGVTVFADPAFAERMKPATDAERKRNGFFSQQHKPAVYGPEFTHAARPEHLLTGSVVDAVTGKPIPGVTVWGTLMPAFVAGRSAWGSKAAAMTDEKGQFTLRGLPKGIVWDIPFVPKEKNRYLHVRAEGAPYLDKVVVVPDTADFTPAKVEVKLRPAVVVSGTLTNKATGKPVRGEVKWFPLKSNQSLALGTDEAAELYVGGLHGTFPSGTRRETGENGRFHLQVPPGPGVVLASADDDDPATVFTSIVVREEDRKYLHKSENGGEEGKRTTARRDDNDEAFDLLKLSWPNRWENGYAVIDPDAKTKSVEAKIEFDPGSTVTLNVTDPDGKPLSGVTVAGDGPLGRRTPTFATPEIRITGLNPKGLPQRLALLHKERKLFAELTVKGDEKVPVVVKMQPCAAVTGRVVDHNGKPVKDAQVFLQMVSYETNNLIPNKLLRDARSIATDAEGKFKLERLFPVHEFDLFVSMPGFRSGEGSKRTSLKPGETQDVGEFRLRDPKQIPEMPDETETRSNEKSDKPKAEAEERTITGIVYGSGGKTIQAELFLVKAEGKPISLAKTRVDGEFRVTVPAHDLTATLVVKADGHGIDFLTPATDTRAVVTFELPKDEPIRGRVVDSQGRPVVGAAVQLRSVGVFEGDSIQPFLDELKKRTNFRQVVRVERRTWRNESAEFLAVQTDAAGRFELTGAGAERFVEVRVGKPGLAVSEVPVVTRNGFDPQPYNAVTQGLRPKSGTENLSWGFNPLLSGPEVTQVLDTEKLIRGKVSDAESGVPRAGAVVTLRQDDGNRLLDLRAVTDAAGGYVIRGAKKWKSYRVQTATDAAKGYLPCNVEFKDTVGYEPVAADVGSPKGVIVTGTLRDRASGKPVAGYLNAYVLSGNDFHKRYPALGQYPRFELQRVGADGAFRAVLFPGPMLLAAGMSQVPNIAEYKPAAPDPKYPELFHDHYGSLGYHGPDGLLGMIDGSWCKVMDLKPSDASTAQDIEFERGLTLSVSVADESGKPVKGVHATGDRHLNIYSATAVGEAAAIPVYNLEPNKDRLVAAIQRERKLIGSVVVRAGEEAPVMKLGTGGAVTGRLVKPGGEPLAGVTVTCLFVRPELAELYRVDQKRTSFVTAADGRFEFPTLLPGYEFRLQFSRGKVSIGPSYAEAPKYKLDKHGQTLELGDLEIKNRTTGGKE